MITMLDCIRRVPGVVRGAVAARKETFAPLFEAYPDFDEIVLIGSGTSYTSSFTGKYAAERASGLRVTVAPPSEFLDSLSARNPRALYLFVSQTGTSILTGEALAYAKGQGWRTAALSESADTPIAKAAGVFVDMRCGHEEYPMRTIGYSVTALDVVLLGMEAGLRSGHLSGDACEALLGDALRAADNIPAVIDGTLAWLEGARRDMLRADCIVFTGSGALHGVALEGAVKLWETPQIISMGYELEEGLHGPNFGYTQRHSVIALDEGGKDSAKACALARYMREQKQNGFLVGVGASSPFDMKLTPAGGEFAFLEFAAVVQTMAYQLAVMQGRDLFAPHDNSVMNSYFRSHSEGI